MHKCLKVQKEQDYNLKHFERGLSPIVVSQQDVEDGLEDAFSRWALFVTVILQRANENKIWFSCFMHTNI